MKCSLLGNGRQAQRLIASISHANVELVAHKSREIDQLIHSDCDAIVITSPDFCHFEHGMKVLKAGKHLFLEKPIATKVEDAKKLIETAKTRNLVLAIDYHQRWSLSLKAIQHHLKLKRFGEIKHIKFHWSWKALKMNCWRNNENPWWALSLLGTHCIDHIIWLFEPIFGPIKTFRGKRDNRHYGLKNEDHAHLEFKFENDITGEIEVNLNQTSSLTLEIETDEKTYIFDHLVGQNQHIKINNDVQYFEYENPWHEAFKAFKKAVETNETFPISPEDALKNLTFLCDI